jgi:hypothetical protein
VSKTLRTAAVVVGAVALVATGVGAAAGAGWIGAAAGSSAATAGALTSATIAATAATVASYASAAAIGLSLASSALATKPKGYLATGSPADFSANPDAGVPIIFGGPFATAGNIVYRRAWDTADAGENDRQSFVTVLSLGPVQSISGFRAEDIPVTFDSGGAATGTYVGFMWQKQQLGACPESAALGFGTGAGTPPTWDAARKLSGLAATTWTLRFDTKAKHFQNGVPEPRWLVEGVRAYDPRKDSTYPGGSGTHRSSNQATWEYTTNPHLCALAWVLGFTQNGQRVAGIGAPVDQIDVAAFVEGANIADLNGWKIAGCGYTTDSKWQLLGALLQAGMAEPLQLGAKISCFTNAPKVSLATITAGDVVGPASVTATQPRRDRINGIVPRYWQAAADWQFLSGTAVRVAAHETEDGGRRTKEVDFPFIPSNAANQDKQIAVACRYAIENAREFGPIVLPLKLRWIGYKPGDCVTANLPELGLVNQQILFLNRDFDPGAGVPTFTARSETTGKHAFALGQTTTPPPTPGVSGPALVPVPGNTAWAITGTSVASSGTPVPALVVAGAVDSPVAQEIVFEYRPFVTGQAADVGWINFGIFPPETTTVTITAIQPSTDYEVAVSYRRNGVTGTRTIYGPATSGVAGAGVVGALTRDPIVVAASSTGTVTSGLPATGTFKVYASGVDVSADCAFSELSETGCTGSINASTGIYTITAMSADTATYAMRAVYNGQNIDKTLSLAKSRAGTNGTNGANGTNGTDGAPGTPGSNGVTLYTWIAYADSSNGTVNFTNGAPGDRRFIGIATNKTTATESSTPSDYTWSAYTGPALFGLVNGANVTLAGNKVIKTGGSGSSWDASAYSSESWVGGATASFKAGTTSSSMMAGLNTDPTTNNSFETIDFAFYFATDNNRIEIYESGLSVYQAASGSGWSTNDVFSMQYDGSTVRYYKNGTLLRTKTGVASGLRLFVDTSLASSGATLIVSGFTAAGAAGPAGPPGTGANVQSKTITAVGTSSSPANSDPIEVKVKNGVTVTVNGTYRINGSASTGGGTIQLQWAESNNGSESWNNLGSPQSDNWGPGDTKQAFPSASFTFTNSDGYDRMIKFRARTYKDGSENLVPTYSSVSVEGAA